MVEDLTDTPWLTELLVGGSIFLGCIAGALGW
jgi:hypothetical protein